MKVNKKSFGKTKDGKDVSIFSITNSNGMTVSFTDYGANIVSIMVPDKNGKLDDLVLGFSNLEGYEENSPGFGSLIGRVANRIAGAKFVLDGKEYKLDNNDGNNTLHGGQKGYNHHIYEAEIIEDEDVTGIEFSRLSPDMEQNFPGNLDITVSYSLTEDNELIIEYFAVSDKNTIVNLTNHSYFNLAGHNSGNIKEHKLWINANSFLPTNEELIPTGEIWDVDGTAMDFRKLKLISECIDTDYEPLKLASNGYDHNFVLNIEGDKVEKVAELVEEKSGRKMTVFTDKPGIQIYTANMLSPVKHAKDEAEYGRWSGICFETQHFPNACNEEKFPSSILHAGVPYDYVTVYKFSNI
ncbi:MAG TPA: galactose mutarotase [Clostridiales bacterium]|nr:galactose mutarotase [Clostridiales bacterium]